MVELNTFFIKHIFPMPAEHPICVFRILLFGLIAAPATRQYYTYVTDPKCKRVGTQCWVFIMVSFSELILVLKFGLELFSQTQISKMVIWILLNILVSCVGVFVSMRIYKWRHKKTENPEEIAASQDELDPKEKVQQYIGDNFGEKSNSSPSLVRHRKVEQN
jgi:phosphatidylserine synthase 1